MRFRIEFFGFSEFNWCWWKTVNSGESPREFVPVQIEVFGSSWGRLVRIAKEAPGLSSSVDPRKLQIAGKLECCSAKNRASSSLSVILQISSSESKQKLIT